MEKKFIEYKILDDPFTEVGPILIGNKAFSSEGFKIQFLPEDESSWVANLGTKNTRLNRVCYLQSPYVLAVGGGDAYVIDTVARKAIANPGYEHYDDLVQDDDGTVILANPTKLTIVESDGSFWDSERISFDGIKDLKILDLVVTGLSYDPRDQSWIPFSYNLKTKELKGGSQKNEKWQVV